MRSQDRESVTVRFNRASRVASIIAGLLVVLPGCQENSQGTTALTPTAVRASRRAFDGAPPVIPHEPLGPACATCHSDLGKPVPGMGFAPANPHAGVSYAGALQNCRQCHVSQAADNSFAATNFTGLRQAVRGGERLFPTAPPVIPHRVFMRENCLSCHDGPGARPEIRCTHPDRVNCRQCHVESGPIEQGPFSQAVVALE